MPIKTSMRTALCALMLAAHWPAASKASDHGHAEQAVPASPVILDGYGAGGFTITTKSPRAQAFFNNGMQLAHAYEHGSAIEAMKEAVRQDPACAMCAWGLAWASGPTLNFGKSPSEIQKLLQQVLAASKLAEASGTERERALIGALKARYVNGGGDKPGDLNFAKAMTALAAGYPADDAIAVIAAEAWLIAPAEGNDENVLNASLAIKLLEPVLARSPDYSPAIHFHIHATEISGRPAASEALADRLPALAPSASHLIHMPSHTYYWVGRYEEAGKLNLKAMEIGLENARRLGLPPPKGVWGLPYHAHNVIFGVGGALMANDGPTALTLARPLVARAKHVSDAEAYMQLVSAIGYAAMGRFAELPEIFSLDAPKAGFLVTAWRYARGEAFARLGNAEGLRRELGLIRGAEAPFDIDSDESVAQQMGFIARDVLQGRLAMLEKRYDDAAIAFRKAAEMQESRGFSAYIDPPAWYYPVRRDLAAALLAKQDYAGARREALAALHYRKGDPDSAEILRQAEARLGNSSATASSGK